jgi:hypothetical protein
MPVGKDQAGVSMWAVVAVLGVLFVGFFLLLGIGGIAWYVIAHRPGPGPVPAPTAPAPGPSAGPTVAPPTVPPSPGPTGPSGDCVRPLPSCATPPTTPPSPAPPAGPVRYARFVDRDGEFTVEYPDTWQVAVASSGVVFYPAGQGPPEGTGAIFSRGMARQGIVPARQDADELVRQSRSRYPDFEVLELSVRPGPFAGTETVFLAARWTNSRGERMRGILLGRYSYSQVANFTLRRVHVFQSQEVAWASLESVFMHMEQSFQPLRQKEENR